CLAVRVVELLADPERLLRRATGTGQDLAELLGALLPELRLGEGKLLLGAAQGVVQADEPLGGLALQLLRGHLGRPAGLDRQVTGSLAALTRGLVAHGGDDLGPGDRDHRHGEQPGEAEAGTAGRLPGAAVLRGSAVVLRCGVDPVGEHLGQSVGRADRRTGPVVVGQVRLDVLAAPRGETVTVHDAGGAGRAVAALVDRDGEQQVVLAEAVEVIGLLGPRGAVCAVELVHEHDEQLQPGLVPQLRETVLDLALLPGQGSHGVGDLVGDLERLLLCRRHAGRERERDGERSTEQERGTPGPHRSAGTPRRLATGSAALGVNCVGHGSIFLSGASGRNCVRGRCRLSPLDLQRPGSVPRSGSLCCAPSSGRAVQSPARDAESEALMTLIPVLAGLLADPDATAVLAAANDEPQVDVAISPGARPAMVAALAQERPVLAVTATGREADDLASALAEFLPAAGIATFPSWETLPHERLSPRSDTVGQRLAVLRRLAHPESGDSAYGPVQVIVASSRALLQPFVAGLGELVPVQLQ